MKIEDLYRSDGKLNSAIIRQVWFKETNLYKDIIEKSDVLGADCKSSFAERVFLYQQTTTRPNCQRCGEKSEFNNKDSIYFVHCGSRSCASFYASKKAVQTKNKLYGSGASPKTIEKARERVKSLNEKGRKTLKDRYGVSNPGQLSNHLEKVRNTLFRRHGVTHQHHVSSAREKRNINSILFYRSLISNNQTIQVKDILEPSCLKKKLYNSPCTVISFSCSIHGDEMLPSETFKWRARKFDTVCSKCLRPYNKTGSIAQQNLSSWIESLGESIKYDDNNLLAPYQIDILIERALIGIEYNGLYWHSYDRVESKEERNRHLHKQDLASSREIRLMQFFEDEWIYKEKIVKSIIASALGKAERKIYARKCNIIKLTESQSKKFLDENHLQGNCNGSAIRLGLEVGGDLVYLITIGKSRFERNKLELLRVSSKLNTLVVGGFSKLMNQAINFLIDSGFEKLYTYSDKRLFTGSTYLKYGFKKNGESPPGYFYTDKDRRLNRMQFQKHLLGSKLEKFDPILTEAENMFNHGYRRIWDCGQLKFELDLNAMRNPSVRMSQ